MKQQVIIIHGGSTFRNTRGYLHYLKTREISLQKKMNWNGDYLDKQLGKNFEIIRPRMPLSENAHYEHWKINFERFIPFLRKDVILIGNSLGGIFLAKYLSENKFPKKIRSVYLVCPPFDNTVKGEDLVNGFVLKKDLSLLEKNTKHLHLLFSKDDPSVPVSHAQKYRANLKNADIVIYESKNGHFRIPKFPEIIRMIKNDVKRA